MSSVTFKDNNKAVGGDGSGDLNLEDGFLSYKPRVGTVRESSVSAVKHYCHSYLYGY